MIVGVNLAVGQVWPNSATKLLWGNSRVGQLCAIFQHYKQRESSRCLTNAHVVRRKNTINGRFRPVRGKSAFMLAALVICASIRRTSMVRRFGAQFSAL
jgi:hypothetical protein